MLIFRSPLKTFGLQGVKPAEFAGLGDYPSPLTDDADLPADANSEWLWCLLPPLIDVTSGGVTQVNRFGGWAHTGAANGTYVQGYRGFVLPPSGSTTVYDSTITLTVGTTALGQALETDQALALTARLLRTIGQAAETDAALPLTARQTRAIGQALETDLALPALAQLPNGLGVALETDSALPMAASQRRTTGLALEIDAALPMTALLLRTIGQAAELDTALPVTFFGAQVRTIGQALEFDTALALLVPGTSPAELSVFWAYDVPALDLQFTVPGSDLAFDLTP